MQIIIALENVMKTFTFPDDSEVHPRSGLHEYLQITPKDGKHYWFNPTYVIAIVPGTRGDS